MQEESADRKVYPLVDARPQAVVIHCSDPRFQKAFREFISEQLHLQDGECIPLVISGGVASLSEPLKLPKEFKFMKQRIEFFLKRFDSIRRIILINHEDCRHYEALRDLLGNVFLHRVAHMTERQKNDLLSVARVVLDFARPDLEIDLYYAALKGGDAVQFERLTTK